MKFRLTDAFKSIAQGVRLKVEHFAEVSLALDNLKLNKLFATLSTFTDIPAAYPNDKTLDEGFLVWYYGRLESGQNYLVDDTKDYSERMLSIAGIMIDPFIGAPEMPEGQEQKSLPYDDFSHMVRSYNQSASSNSTISTSGKVITPFWWYYKVDFPGNPPTTIDFITHRSRFRCDFYTGIGSSIPSASFPSLGVEQGLYYGFVQMEDKHPYDIQGKGGGNLVFWCDSSTSDLYVKRSTEGFGGGTPDSVDVYFVSYCSPRMRDI